MSRLSVTTGPRAGDRIEVRGIPGAAARHGVIVEVLGEGPHEHYRVLWDEKQESLFFPGAGEGVHVIHPRRPPSRGRSAQR